MSNEKRKQYKGSGWVSWVERTSISTDQGDRLAFVRFIKLETDLRDVTVSELAERYGINQNCLLYRIRKGTPMPALVSQEHVKLHTKTIEVAFQLNEIYTRIKADGVISRKETIKIAGNSTNRHITLFKNLIDIFDDFKRFKHGPAVIYYFDENHPAVHPAIDAIKNKPTKRQLRLEASTYSQAGRIRETESQAAVLLSKLKKQGWFSRLDVLEELGISEARWKGLLIKVRKVKKIHSISTGKRDGGWIYYPPGDKRYVAELDRLGLSHRVERQEAAAEKRRKDLEQRTADRYQNAINRERPAPITEQHRQNTMAIARQATAKQDPVKSWLYGSALRA